MNAPFNATREANAAVQDYLQSKIMHAFAERQDLTRANPLLAFAYWIEAAGDRRIEGDQCAMSLLTDMRDRAREAIERHTGKPFSNTPYPVRS
jgi:hypothetical protein